MGRNDSTSELMESIQRHSARSQVWNKETPGLVLLIFCSLSLVSIIYFLPFPSIWLLNNMVILIAEVQHETFCLTCRCSVPRELQDTSMLF